jgi:histidinol-phosphatase (PHP family)
MEDYVIESINQGLFCIGFSDHTPLPKNIFPQVRMKYSDLKTYFNEIKTLSNKYTNIKILSALECEYFTEFENFYKIKILKKYNPAYLIGGTHYIKSSISNNWKSVFSDINSNKELFEYARTIITSMESGLFLFIAHPDLFMNSYQKWDKNAISCSKEILDFAEKSKSIFEINGYGIRKQQDPFKKNKTLYPFEKFWKLCSNYNIKIILSSDAHDPNDIYSGIFEAERIAKKYNLQIVKFDDLGI